MSLRSRDVRLAVLQLRNRRMLEDQKNVPLSTIMSNREWSRPENQEPDIRNMSGSGRAIGAGSCGCGGAKKQGEKDREDEKLAMEVKGLKDKEGGAYTGAGAKKLGEDYAKEILENEPELKGSGFFGDFWDGFKSVVNPVSHVVSSVAHMIPHPAAQALATGADVVGSATGGAPKRKPKKKKKVDIVMQEEDDDEEMDELTELMGEMSFRPPKPSGRETVRGVFDKKVRGEKRGRRRDDDDDVDMDMGAADIEVEEPSKRRKRRKPRVKKHRVKKENIEMEAQMDTEDSDSDVVMKKGDGKKKRKMNAYMSALQKARKSGANSFVYNGKTYVKSKTKTGMVIYKKK